MGYVNSIKKTVFNIVLNIRTSLASRFRRVSKPELRNTQKLDSKPEKHRIGSLVLNPFQTDKSSFAFFLVLAGLLCVISIAAPLIVPNDPYKTDLLKALLPPCFEFPFGTDKLGRCLFSRVLCGASTSIFCSVLLVGIVSLIGTSIGVVSGYVGGVLDAVIMRIVDVFLAFPGIILSIAIAGVLGAGLKNAIIAISCIAWTKYARLARSQTLAMRNADFIIAARLGGSNPLKIIFTHVLPNTVGLLVVTAALDIGVMMMELAALSFLGLGVTPPTPEWGSMMSEGRSLLQQTPWLTLFPGGAILISVMVFNLLGDSVRDLLDPQRKVM